MARGTLTLKHSKAVGKIKGTHVTQAAYTLRTIFPSSDLVFLQQNHVLASLPREALFCKK
jgi:hypothetical protein